MLDETIGWKRQDSVYVVMYQSRKSGGTYTEVRRTQKGLSRLLKTLEFLDYKDDEIIVNTVPKAWMPEEKKKDKKNKNGKHNKSSKSNKSGSKNVQVAKRKILSMDKIQKHDSSRYCDVT